MADPFDENAPKQVTRLEELYSHQIPDGYTIAVTVESNQWRYPSAYDNAPEPPHPEYTWTFQQEIPKPPVFLNEREFTAWMKKYFVDAFLSQMWERRNWIGIKAGFDENGK